MTRPQLTGRLLRMAAAFFLLGCMGAAITAINPLTGERRYFDSASEVPDGWIVCASEETCPAPRACTELEEAACLTRSDCSPLYLAPGGVLPPECGEPDPPALCGGESYAGCSATAATCAPADCGAAPFVMPHVCSDGTLGGPTGRCVVAPDGACEWEFRACQPPRPAECEPRECGPAPLLPALECADGSVGGNTGRCLLAADGTCAWEVRECPSIECSALPVCDLLCPEGTMNPVDETGCVHTCECVPSTCTDAECGPAPGAPAYECADGSLGGNIGVCERNAEGTCGWVIRDCPADECAPGSCGPALGTPAIVCEDGSTGGNTGRCLRDAAGVCTWEIRECPDPCREVPVCDVLCPPGTHNPSDAAGCVLTCECAPDVP